MSGEIFTLKMAVRLNIYAPFFVILPSTTKK